MLIRQANLTDLNACLELNADSQTDHVWQMEHRPESHGRSVRFQEVRLPRVMYVSYPRIRDDLVTCWENGSAVLVVTNKPGKLADEGRDRDEMTDVALQRSALQHPDADNQSSLFIPSETVTDKLPPTPIFGYCQIDEQSWQKTGWIAHLIVNRPFRRRGLGTALLKGCIAWAHSRKLDRLTIAVQTKNYPAIAFCQKNGFTFCGFNDQYFVNRDIALFFTMAV